MKTFKMFLAEQDDKIRVGPKTIDFLSQWTEGSNRATQHLNFAVESQLARSVKEDSYKVYRGFRITDESECEDKLGVQFSDLAKGKTAELKVKGPTSWTRSKTVAEKFANPKFDAINHEFFSADEIDEMGYDDGELLGIGIVVEATIKSKDVLADLKNIDTRHLTYGENEDEIIVKEGQIKAKVLEIEFTHHGDAPPSDGDEDGVEAEMELMNKLTLQLPKILKKLGYDLENEDDLIRAADKNSDEDDIIAMLQLYGNKPKFVEHIRKTKDRYKKVYKHHSIDNILRLRDMVYNHLKNNK